MSKIIVIPDSHDEPSINNDRFRWLSRLIADENPTHVVHLGDHWDVAGAGKFDKGTLAGEGQRIQAEIKSGAASLALIKSEVPKAMARRIKWIFLDGNHEERLNIFAFENPEWEGMVGTAMLPLSGWKHVPFLKPVEIRGVWFSHYFPSGVLNKPIGGINAARSALLKLGHSVVWGHSHEFSYAMLRSPLTGIAIHALNAGCYFEHHPAYAGPASMLYTRGIFILHDCEQGDYDLEFVSMHRMKRKYGH